MPDERLKPKPSNPLVQKKRPDSRWEMIESDESARAVLIFVFSWGASRHDAVDLLRTLGFNMGDGGVRGRLLYFQGADRRKTYAGYLLSKRPAISPEIFEKYQSVVRRHLLESKFASTKLWTRCDDLRAMAVFLLQNTSNFGEIARTLSFYLEKPELLSNADIDNAVKRSTGEREGGTVNDLINKLMEGNPPLIRALTDADLEKAAVDVREPREAALSRLHERSESEVLKDEKTRAFALALIANNIVKLSHISWMIKRKFPGTDVDKFYFHEAIRAGNPPKGASQREKRARFAETRKKGIRKEIREQMDVLAEEVVAEYVDHLQKQRIALQLLKDVRAIRGREIADRNNYQPFQKFVEKIKNRSHGLTSLSPQETDPPVAASISLLRTKGTTSNLATLSITIRDNTSEATLALYYYILHELKEVEAGYPGILRDALIGESTDEPLIRVILHGPQEEGSEIFTFEDLAAQPTRQ